MSRCFGELATKQRLTQALCCVGSIFCLFVCFFLYESCFEYMNISCVYNRIQYQRLIKLIIIIIIIIITITIIVIIITVLIMMILLTV